MPFISKGDKVTIEAFDEVPEHKFLVETVKEDLITGFAITGPLAGCYGEPDLTLVKEAANEL